MIVHCLNLELSRNTNRYTYSPGMLKYTLKQQNQWERTGPAWVLCVCTTHPCSPSISQRQNGISFVLSLFRHSSSVLCSVPIAICHCQSLTWSVSHHALTTGLTLTDSHSETVAALPVPAVTAIWIYGFVHLNHFYNSFIFYDRAQFCLNTKRKLHPLTDFSDVPKLLGLWNINEQHLKRMWTVLLRMWRQPTGCQSSGMGRTLLPMQQFEIPSEFVG